MCCITIVLVTFVLIIWLLRRHKPIEYFTSEPIIWSYWENNQTRRQTPEYIKLCFETFHKYNKNFEIKILDQTTIAFYLPNLNLDHLSITHKSDYIRIALLYHYGGIWIDADTIVVRNLTPIIDKLDEYDFIGFGCSYATCKTSGFPRPSNGVMASRRYGKFVANVLNRLDTLIANSRERNFGYFDLGKNVLWHALDEIIPHGYKYYHYPASFDGSRDINGNWINADNHVSTSPTIFLNENDLFFIFLENNKFMGKYEWFSNLNRDQILFGPWWISTLFRKYLGIDPYIRTPRYETITRL